MTSKSAKELLKRVTQAIENQDGAQIKQIYLNTVMTILESVSDRSAMELAFKAITGRLSEDQVKTLASDLLPEHEFMAKGNFKRQLRELRAEILTLENTLRKRVKSGSAAAMDELEEKQQVIRKRDAKRLEKEKQ